MKVAIVEDEPINANELIALINQYDDKILIDPVMDTIEAVISYLQNEQPDLLFLDIELADGISFEIFNHVNVECPIVFTTAYDQYALKAFEQNSISYLLKPITFEKLKTVFDKFSSMKKIFKSDIDSILANRTAYKQNFLVRSGNKLVPLNLSQIAYFYSEDNIAYIVSNEPKKYLSGYNLYQLEEILDPKKFFRINRQYIVNREAISHLKAYVKGQVKLYIKGMVDSTIISRQKTPLLKEWLS